MENITKLISDFIEGIRLKYPSIVIEVSKASFDDAILIYHDYPLFDDDMDFIQCYLSLQDKCFYSKDVFHIGFSYNHQLAEKTLTKVLRWKSGSEEDCPRMSYRLKERSQGEAMAFYNEFSVNIAA